MGNHSKNRQRQLKIKERKQVKALQISKSPEHQKLKSFEDKFPKELPNTEMEKELDEIKTIKEKNDKKDLTSKTNIHYFNHQ